MTHKNYDYKINAFDYYLTENKYQEEVCKQNTKRIEIFSNVLIKNYNNM